MHTKVWSHLSYLCGRGVASEASDCIFSVVGHSIIHDLCLTAPNVNKKPNRHFTRTQKIWKDISNACIWMIKPEVTTDATKKQASNTNSQRNESIALHRRKKGKYILVSTRQLCVVLFHKTLFKFVHREKPPSVFGGYIISKACICCALLLSFKLSRWHFYVTKKKQFGWHFAACESHST